MKKIREATTILFIFGLTLLSACAISAPDAAVPADLNQQLLTLGIDPYVTPTPQVQEEAISAATQPALPVNCPLPYSETESIRPEFNLYIYLGVEEHAGYVDQRIIYPNRTGRALDELLMVVEPNWTPGVFSLSALQLAGEQVYDYRLEGGTLHLPLETPLPDGCALDLRLEYHLALPEQPGIFGYTEDQLVLTNWYPFVPPYDSEHGWVVHDPGLYGEHLVYPAADFSVTLELANSPDNVLVAAAAPAEQEGNRYQYTLDGARTFSLAVLSGYSVQGHQLNGIDISVYSKRATLREVEAAMNTAIAALQVFGRVFGPYPFQSLTIAQLEMYDGMEYDGIFFLGEEVFETYNWGPRNMLVFLVAHETSHSWWFSQVANDQALEPWLDEALATYCEVLFYELVYPEDVEWWWEFRVAEYEPVGYVDASIYTYDIYEAYRQAVYLRGVEFFQALREEMGDEDFFAFLRMYLERGRYQLMTTEDFFALLEGEFSVEVDGLRQEFFGEW
jgi:hypothetical protein